MCGISGIVALEGKIQQPELVIFMADEIRHRGPDDEGYVFIDQSRDKCETFCGQDSPESIKSQQKMFSLEGLGFSPSIALAHRRFSIIDLSPAGHQPMFDQSGDTCIVFNGEIYNYIEVSEELEAKGIQFLTRSDTEVILEAYKFWGTDSFRKFNGFWALAIYDFKQKKLILSRDRLGKKPLYWARQGDSIYFASEIKSLLVIPGISQSVSVNETAIWHWCVDRLRDLNHSTFFNGITAFPKASWAVVDRSFPDNAVTFWKLPRKRLKEKDIAIKEASSQIRDLLGDAVRLRMRADVPLAIELSGGLDSSSLLALAAIQTDKKLTTYTVKFDEERWNEEPYARSIASKYNVDYKVIEPRVTDFWCNINKFTKLEEEPYHSPNLMLSQIVWSLMRESGTKVSLNGAAADELFAGYGMYFRKAQTENILKGNFKQFRNNSKGWTEGTLGISDAIVQLSTLLHLKGPARRIKRKITDENYYVKDLKDTYVEYDRATLSEYLYSEINNTKIPYWLSSGDKGYMGVPFESRAPFLDYRVVELAASLPITYLIRDGWHKWILRKAMENLLPEDVVWRRIKMGYPFPYETFLKQSKSIIEFILENSSTPYINYEHPSIKADWHTLSYILWYEHYINKNHKLFEDIENMSEKAKMDQFGFKPLYLV